jgi:diguanylate cyclase (GGDEF)-like protein
VAIAGVAAVYLLPMILIGPPRYPEGGWRMGLLLFVLSTALGVSIRQLVGRVEALMQRLEALARTDDLTGLANRRAWRERLEQELTTARRTGRALAVALFDLDLFKEYNDARGHLAGDRLLLQASAAWQSVLRSTDVLARWGGDEFGLLLPDCDLEQGQALVDRMRAALPEVTFSAGVVEWDRHSDSEELVASADRELYSAKQAKSLRSLRSGAV